MSSTNTIERADSPAICARVESSLATHPLEQPDDLRAWWFPDARTTRQADAIYSDDGLLLKLRRVGVPGYTMTTGERAMRVYESSDGTGIVGGLVERIDAWERLAAEATEVLRLSRVLDDVSAVLAASYEADSSVRWCRLDDVEAVAVYSAACDPRRLIADAMQRALKNPPAESGKAGGIGGGMSAEQARTEAERMVRANAGKWPGLNNLARQIVCSTATVTKAVENSTYLKARRAEREAGKPKAGRTVSLAYDPKDTTADGPADVAERNELSRLTAEQRAEALRDERQYQKAARSRAV